MKRFLSYVILVIFAFVGCSLELPQSISVKTKAEYNFSIGKISAAFSDFFSVNEITKTFNENKIGDTEFSQRIKIYDYNPEKKSDKKQQFLIEVPVANVPIDFSEYYAETALADSIKETSFSTEIAIPKLDMETSTQESLLSVQSAVNSSVSFSGKTSSNVSINFDDFSYVDYSYGTFCINLQGENASDVNSVTLYDADGNLVGYSENFSNSLFIDLTNVRISSKGMRLCFSGASGVEFLAFCDPYSSINAVNGVKKTFSVEIEPSVNLELAEMGILTCEVEKGSVSVELNVPSEVGNLEIGYKVVLSGAIDAVSNSSKEKKEISLNGKSINNGDLKVKTLFDISLNDGPVNFDNYVTTLIGLSIDSLNKISMRVDNAKTNLTETNQFSKEVKDFVKSVTLTNSGIKGKFTNELPKGNDITVYGKSTFLGLDDSEILGAENIEKEFELLADETEKLRFIENSDGMDFDLSILLPGATEENPNVITLKNVETEKKYKMEYIVEPVLNWTEIVVIQVKDQKSYQGESELDLNLSNSDFMSKFDGKIMPKDICMHVFFEKPDLQSLNQVTFNNVKLNVVNIKKDEAGNTISSEESDSEPFSEVSWGVSPELEFENDVVITDFNTVENKKTVDLTEQMKDCYDNNGESALLIDYTVDIALGTNSELTITNDDIKDSEVKSIAITAYIVFPMYFEATELFELDLSEMMGFESGADLLGRTEAPSENEMIEALDVIESASLIYESTKLPLHFPENSPVRFKISLYGETEPATEFGLDKGEIIVNPEKLMTAYPICPDVNLIIPKTSFSITRDMGISLDIAVRLKTDETVKIFGGK